MPFEQHSGLWSIRQARSCWPIIPDRLLESVRQQCQTNKQTLMRPKKHREYKAKEHFVMSSSTNCTCINDECAKNQFSQIICNFKDASATKGGGSFLKVLYIIWACVLWKKSLYIRRRLSLQPCKQNCVAVLRHSGALSEMLILACWSLAGIMCMMCIFFVEHVSMLAFAYQQQTLSAAECNVICFSHILSQTKLLYVLTCWWWRKSEGHQSW